MEESMAARKHTPGDSPNSIVVAYLVGMDLYNAAEGMCQLANVELKSVTSFRFRRGQGQQDVYFELHAGSKKMRSYINAANGQITEVDVREVHDNPSSSKLLDVANQLAKESASMDAFRSGLNKS